MYPGLCAGLSPESESVFVNSGNNSLELLSSLEDFVHSMTAISVYQCIVSVGALSHQLILILAIYPHDLQIYAGLCLRLHRDFASN